MCKDGHPTTGVLAFFHANAPIRVCVAKKMPGELAQIGTILLTISSHFFMGSGGRTFLFYLSIFHYLSQLISLPLSLSLSPCTYQLYFNAAFSVSFISAFRPLFFVYKFIFYIILYPTFHLKSIRLYSSITFIF